MSVFAANSSPSELKNLNMFQEIAEYFPGILFSVTIGMAATFVSGAYGGPTVLFALLLGMAFNFISAGSRLAPGIAFSARSILRIGVAALGARITAEQVLSLGWSTARPPRPDRFTDAAAARHRAAITRHRRSTPPLPSRGDWYDMLQRESQRGRPATRASSTGKRSSTCCTRRIASSPARAATSCSATASCIRRSASPRMPTASRSSARSTASAASASRAASRSSRASASQAAGGASPTRR